MFVSPMKDYLISLIQPTITISQVKVEFPLTGSRFIGVNSCLQKLDTILGIIVNNFNNKS